MQGLQGPQGPPGVTVINTSNTAYVSNSGNDGTGQVGNAARPFLTLDAALAATMKTDANTPDISNDTNSGTIYLYTGIYSLDSQTLTGFADSLGIHTNIHIVGPGFSDVTINITGAPLTLNNINITFHSVTLASVNMPVIVTDPNTLAVIISFSNCYVQSTYNGSSSPGTNYVVAAYANSFIRFDNSVVALFSTPDNPTDIVMVYNEFSMTMSKTRLYSYIISPGLTNVPSKLDFVGGKGDFDLTYNYILLSVPGNAEFSNVSVIYPTGTLTLSLIELGMANFIPGTQIPAGKLFQFFDPSSTIDNNSNFTLSNVTITGLSSFENVSTVFPAIGSYRNVSWDFDSLPDNGFFVDKYGGINVRTLAPEATSFSGDYTLTLIDYLLVFTGNTGTLTLLPANNNGRIISVVNGGTGSLTITTSTTGLIAPNVLAVMGSVSIVLQPGRGITLQYITSLNQWVATGAT